MFKLIDYDVETTRVVLKGWRDFNKSLERLLINEPPGTKHEFCYHDGIDPWEEEERERELLEGPGCHCNYEFENGHTCNCVNVDDIDDNDFAPPDDPRVLAWLCYDFDHAKIREICRRGNIFLGEPL